MYAHSTRSHIPQPPHSAGQTLKGFRTAIDPAQIPSPVDAIERDRGTYEHLEFTSIPGERPPLATTEYIAQDYGTSSPKFIRFTTWNIPSNSRLARDCEIPLAAIIQPFANQHPWEEPVPLVESGPSGPSRCGKCRGYINHWCTWESGGSRWKCNLCGFETAVSNEYFSNLDGAGRRLDYLQRPELNKGTVDFAVPNEYWAPHPAPRLTPSYFSVESSPLPLKREPKPMDYVFAFDLSVDAVQSGFVQAAANLLKTCLLGQAEDGQWVQPPCFSPASRVAIITYDQNLHFYDLSKERASMLVVSDIDEIFLPIREGLFVNPHESRDAINDLLSTLSERTEDTFGQSCLGSAVRGGLAAIAGRGGHLVMFQSSLPSRGPGKVEPRANESTLYDTDKERTLFIPQDPAWTTIAEECAEEGVGITVFLAPSKFVDVGSIGVLSQITGGDLFFHPRFDAARDTVSLSSQLQRVISRTTGYDCLFRVRCSSALRVTSLYGTFHPKSDTDLALGLLHGDAALSVSFAHTGRLEAREYAHIQAAVLYTSVEGQRRVRVINLALQVADLAGNVFKYADMDAVVCHLTKEAMSRLPEKKMSVIKEELSDKCAAILLGYRKNCAAATAPSQLILPEAFKALPAYVMGILKTKPLKGRNVAADVRNYHIHRILSSGVREVVNMVYPRVLALHDLDDTIALPNAQGQVECPSLMRASYTAMEANGIYLADNEEMAIFWVGLGASPGQIKDLFGADDITELGPNLIQLPHLPNLLSTQVQNILASRRAQRGGREPKLLLARQNTDGTELEFADMLVEDQNNSNLSYVDFLCQVHRQIHTVLTQGGSIHGSQSMRGTPW